jgi:hypothetical protein
VKTRFAFSIVVLLASMACAQTPVDVLHRARPQAKWEMKSAKAGDVDCDGKADTVVLGSEGKTVLVGIVQAAPKSSPIVLEFSIDPAQQDAFCAAPTVIEMSNMDCQSDAGRLEGCKSSKSCKQFTVSDDKCDSFHFYWDAKQKGIRWWRL